jgi:hypothetical protein
MTSRFPRSPIAVRWGRCPALPLQPRRAYIAVFRAAFGRHRLRRPEALFPWVAGRPLLRRPISPRFEPVDESRGLRRWFTCVAPSHLACAAPTAGSSTGPLRCQDCFPALRPCRRVACPRLFGTAATAPGGPLNPHGKSAPRGAQPTSSITSSATLMCLRCRSRLGCSSASRLRAASRSSSRWKATEKPFSMARTPSAMARCVLPTPGRPPPHCSRTILCEDPLPLPPALRTRDRGDPLPPIDRWSRSRRRVARWHAQHGARLDDRPRGVR